MQKDTRVWKCTSTGYPLESASQSISPYRRTLSWAFDILLCVIAISVRNGRNRRLVLLRTNISFCGLIWIWQKDSVFFKCDKANLDCHSNWQASWKYFTVFAVQSCVQFKPWFSIRFRKNHPRRGWITTAHTWKVYIRYHRVVSCLLGAAVHASDKNTGCSQSAFQSEQQVITAVRVPEKYPDLFGSDDELVYVAVQCSGAAFSKQFTRDV